VPKYSFEEAEAARNEVKKVDVVKIAAEATRKVGLKKKLKQ